MGTTGLVRSRKIRRRGTEGERLEGADDSAATPNKISENIASQKIPSTTMSSDDAPQKEQETVVKAIPANNSYSGPPTVKVKEPKEQTSAWGELHSMNEQLGHLYLGSSRVVIGRHRDCTLCLQGPLISGKHCTITRQIYEGGGGQIECYFILDTR